jgi:hypothetical protein
MVNGRILVQPRLGASGIGHQHHPGGGEALSQACPREAAPLEQRKN